MIAVIVFSTVKNIIGATSGFLLSLLLNPNCRGRGNVVSSLRDSFRYELSSAIMFREVHFQILRCIFRVGSNGYVFSHSVT